MIHIPDFAQASTVQIIFCFLAFITVITAFLTIFSRNPIHSALYLVICFFSIAGHYLLLNSEFLAIVHIIVYSGAIMILFVFTIMLMNLNKEPCIRLIEHVPTLLWIDNLLPSQCIRQLLVLN